MRKHNRNGIPRRDILHLSTKKTTNSRGSERAYEYKIHNEAQMLQP